MSRATSRLRRLEQRARRDPSLEVWHEILGQPGRFERLGPWQPGQRETTTREHLDTTDPPEGVRRIVVAYEDGEPRVAD